jgi:hypothetical protein
LEYRDAKAFLDPVGTGRRGVASRIHRI